MVIEQIVADYERPLRRLAKCYTRESSIAEDLFQEIVLALCGAFAISFAAKGRRDRLRLRPLTEADSVVNEGQETRDRALLLAAVRKLQMPTSSWSCFIWKDFRRWRWRSDARSLAKRY